MRHPRLSASPGRLVGTALLLCLCSIRAYAQSAAPATDTSLAQRIDAILARDEVARGFWGVEIEELDGGRILYSRDADRLFVPASNAKLFITAAALALIGTGYRTQTTVESAGPPDKYGRLSGDLVLVGRGDPNLSGRALPFKIKTERPLPPAHVIDELADQLVARGVKIIDGDIVGDDSFFVEEPYGQGWSQQDVVSMWGAPVSALAVNDDVVYLNVLPADRAGERAFVSLSPYAEYYRIDNRVLTTAPGTPRRISIRRRPGGHRLELRGSIPLGANPLNDAGYGEALAVDDPAQWAALLLREALARRGVVVYGHVRAHHLESEPTSGGAPNLAPSGRLGMDSAAALSDPLLPKEGRGGAPVTKPQPVVLAEHLSLPLSLDIRVINKVSQNLHAEMLLRLLGREKGAPNKPDSGLLGQSSGSVAGGLEVLRGFLKLAGIAPEEYALYDGCGLSRHNLVSPHATVKLLRYAAHQPWGPEFIDSLPLAGVDGTLASRLQGLPATAMLHAKTGQLEHVNVLSGYVTNAAGRRLVFSILSNNHPLSGRKADEVIDEIVTEIQRSRD